MITGDTNVEKVKHLKETAIDIFHKADFELHKWHSNVPELESEVKPSDESGQSFAKQQLGVGNDETKLLGLQWNKAEDTITVTFPECEETPTNRIVLRTMARSMVIPLAMAVIMESRLWLISEEISHNSEERTGGRTHVNKSGEKYEKSLGKSIHSKRLRLPQEYSGFTLDQRKWRVQTICVQSCEKD